MRCSQVTLLSPGEMALVLATRDLCTPSWNHSVFNMNTQGGLVSLKFQGDAGLNTQA